MQVLAVNVSLSCRQCLASRLEATGYWNDLCILYQAAQHGMWRAPLCHSDLHPRPVDFLGVGRCRARTRDIAVVDFHEGRAERQVVSARRIACSEPDVPVISREAFIVARGIIVRLELDRNAEM